MKFSVLPSHLNAALSEVSRALPAKGEKTQLEFIHLAANDEGLILTASDGSMTITALSDAQVSDGGRILVPGKLFIDMMRRLPDQEVLCTVNERMMMNLRCGSIKANLACSDEDFPETPDLSSVPAFHLEKNILSDMINKVVFAISAQDSRIMLTGALMELTREELRLVALDGFRLSLQIRHESFILPDGKEQISAVIPGKVLSTLCAIMEANGDQAVTLRFSGEKMCAVIGGVELSAGLLVGEFIPYRQILPGSFTTRMRVNRRQLQDAVNRASRFAQEGKNNLIKLDIEPDVLCISSDSEIGDDQEELSAFVEGNTLKIAFNSRYLGDVIRVCEEEEMLFCMNSGVSPCVVMPREGDAYLYLILPVRIL